MAGEAGSDDEPEKKTRNELLEEIKKLIEPLATRDDLQSLATREELAKFRRATAKAIAELQDKVTAIGRESEMVATQMAITINGAARAAGLGGYRATSKVPPPTQADQSGFSFDPIHRRPFGPRYG